MSRTRVKTLAYDTLEANKRFFGNDISKVPRQALTVGVGTVMDAKEVISIVFYDPKCEALCNVWLRAVVTSIKKAVQGEDLQLLYSSVVNSQTTQN